MKYDRLAHRFVSELPEVLELGVLYVSMDYATAAHSCCCGCREEVVTPFTPTDWSMTFDGESISLHPSIGSWTLACRSHYIIKKGKIIDAKPWTDKQIAEERQRDHASKQRFYNSVVPDIGPAPIPYVPTSTDQPAWWRRIWKRIFKP